MIYSKADKEQPVSADLYDDSAIVTPEPRFVDLSSLGKLRFTHCTDERGVLVFENGSAAVTPETWLGFVEVFTRKGQEAA